MIPYVRPALAGLLLLAVASPSFARDDVVMLPIGAAMTTPEAQQKLGTSIKFYFGTRPTTPITAEFGRFVANPKTNAFAKSEGRVCDRVFLSALLSLQEHAESVGANAVINITSYYKKHEVASPTDYECHKGFLVAGVALRGDVVRLAGH